MLKSSCSVRGAPVPLGRPGTVGPIRSAPSGIRSRCATVAASSETKQDTCMEKQPRWSRGVEVAGQHGLSLLTAAAVIVGSLGYAGSSFADSADTSGKSFELAYYAPDVTTTSTDEAVSIATRLRAAGAKMYGAFWCSHCYQQKLIFGKQAMKEFPYVECFPSGWKEGVQMESSCKEANVRAFPTWVINGKNIEGELTLNAITYELDGTAEKEAAAARDAYEALMSGGF